MGAVVAHMPRPDTLRPSGDLLAGVLVYPCVHLRVPAPQDPQVPLTQGCHGLARVPQRPTPPK